jgi:hypothetical protein
MLNILFIMYKGRQSTFNSKSTPKIDSLNRAKANKHDHLKTAVGSLRRSFYLVSALQIVQKTIFN